MKAPFGQDQAPYLRDHIDNSIPTAAKFTIMKEEPKLMNGNGSPVIGIRPIDMPMF